MSDPADTPPFPVPQSGGTSYKIRFIDADYPRQPGAPLENITVRGDTAQPFDDYAFNLTGSPIQEGDTITVARYVAKGDRTQRGEWYVVSHSKSSAVWFGTTTSIIPSDGTTTGTVDVEINNKGAIATEEINAVSYFKEEISSGILVVGGWGPDGVARIFAAECESAPAESWAGSSTPMNGLVGPLQVPLVLDSQSNLLFDYSATPAPQLTAKFDGLAEYAIEAYWEANIANNQEAGILMDLISISGTPQIKGPALADIFAHSRIGVYPKHASSGGLMRVSVGDVIALEASNYDPILVQTGTTNLTEFLLVFAAQ